MGWTSGSGPLDVTTEAGQRIALLQAELGAWQHALRQSFRSAAWRQAAARRTNLQGIEFGINWDATMALMEGGRSGAKKENMLRTILADGVWTQDRKYRANMCATAACPHCGQGVVEDHVHLWWQCQAWSHIRTLHPDAQDVFDGGVADCFAKCGLVPEGWEARSVAGRHPTELDQAVVGEEEPVEVIDLTAEEEVPDQWAEAARRYGETWVQGRVVVYTDGAARNNQYRALRKAGVGAFWSKGHPFNVSQALQGDIQTNNRAELMAVVQAMELELRPIEVRTDSAYVYNGIAKDMQLWKSKGWRKKGRLISHWDL